MLSILLSSSPIRAYPDVHILRCRFILLDLDDFGQVVYRGGFVVGQGFEGGPGVVCIGSTEPEPPPYGAAEKAEVQFQFVILVV